MPPIRHREGLLARKFLNARRVTAMVGRGFARHWFAVMFAASAAKFDVSRAARPARSL